MMPTAMTSSMLSTLIRTVQCDDDGGAVSVADWPQTMVQRTTFRHRVWPCHRLCGCAASGQRHTCRLATCPRPLPRSTPCGSCGSCRHTPVNTATSQHITLQYTVHLAGLVGLAATLRWTLQHHSTSQYTTVHRAPCGSSRHTSVNTATSQYITIHSAPCGSCRHTPVNTAKSQYITVHYTTQCTLWVLPPHSVEHCNITAHHGTLKLHSAPCGSLYNGIYSTQCILRLLPIQSGEHCNITVHNIQCALWFLPPHSGECYSIITE